MNKPRLITFTGVDDSINLKDLQDISNAYPVEWGVLFSKSQVGQGRYASLNMLDKIATFDFNSNVQFAAHVCGSYARQLINAEDSLYLGGGFIYMENFGTYLDKYLKKTNAFRRMQVNVAKANESNLKLAVEILGLPEPILQTRGEEFPAFNSVYYLFDQSGGNGQTPSVWPKHKRSEFVGYAGGLGLDNIVETIENINSENPYWMDMETKLRTNDKLDLQICLDICKRVWDA